MSAAVHAVQTPLARSHDVPVGQDAGSVAHDGAHSPAATSAAVQGRQAVDGSSHRYPAGQWQDVLAGTQARSTHVSLGAQSVSRLQRPGPGMHWYPVEPVAAQLHPLGQIDRNGPQPQVEPRQVPGSHVLPAQYHPFGQAMPLPQIGTHAAPSQTAPASHASHRSSQKPDEPHCRSDGQPFAIPAHGSSHRPSGV